MNNHWPIRSRLRENRGRDVTDHITNIGGYVYVGMGMLYRNTKPSGGRWGISVSVYRREHVRYSTTYMMFTYYMLYVSGVSNGQSSTVRV